MGLLMRISIKDLRWEVAEEGESESVYIGSARAGEACCLGITDPARQRIAIHKDLPQQQKRRTLVHELAHAYLFSYGIRSGAGFDEEAICDFVSIYGREIIAAADMIGKAFGWKA